MASGFLGDRYLVVMVCWVSSAVFPGAPVETAFLEKRVARLLAGGWSLDPAFSVGSGGTAFLEKRVARFISGGWSFDHAYSINSGGTVFLEKRMTD